jgi:guanylate kinase
MSEAQPVPVLLLISAPSGAGKTTVCERLLANTPGLEQVVTCTTRRPRGTERDGVDYHFLTSGEFARRVAAGEFLEHATVYGQSYGTLRASVFEPLQAGRDLLLTLDVQGTASVRALAAADPGLGRSLVTVFLVPPSLAELERRLVGRGQDVPGVIRRRLAAARAEMAHWRQFDYLAVSRSITDTLRRVAAIYAAEKMRPVRAAGPELEAGDAAGGQAR